MTVTPSAKHLIFWSSNYQAKIKYVYITVKTATVPIKNRIVSTNKKQGIWTFMLAIHSTAHTGKLDWWILAKLFIGQPTKQES